MIREELFIARGGRETRLSFLLLPPLFFFFFLPEYRKTYSLSQVLEFQYLAPIEKKEKQT